MANPFELMPGQKIPVPVARPETAQLPGGFTTDDDIPALPAGFTLDPVKAVGDIPALPPGFKLDEPAGVAAEADDAGVFSEIGKGVAAGATNVVGTMLKGVGANEARSPTEETVYAELVAQLPRVKDMNADEWAAFQKKAMTGVRGGNEINLLVKATNIRNGIDTPEADTVPLDVLPKQELEDVPIFKTGRKMQQFAKDKFAAAKSYEDTWTRSISEGLGSTVPFLAAGALGPLAGGAVGAGAGSYASSGEAVDKAIQAGATKEQIMQAARYGQLPGLTEQVPMETLLERIPLPHMGRVIGAIGKVVAQAAVEGGQEAAQQAAQNIIARYVYRPDQDISEGVLEAAAVGAAVGGTMKGGEMAASGAVNAVRGRPANEQVEAEAQVEGEAIPALPEGFTLDDMPTIDVDKGPRIAGAQPSDEAADSTDTQPTPAGGDEGIRVTRTPDPETAVLGPATAEQRAILRRSMVPDADIDAMSPEEVAAQVEEARSAGVRVNPRMIQVAGEYRPAREDFSEVTTRDEEIRPTNLEAESVQPNADATPLPVEAEPVLDEQALDTELANVEQDSRVLDELEREAAAAASEEVAQADPNAGSRARPVRVEQPADMEVAGQRVNVEPTEAQAAAGNYRKGHVKVGGLDVTIENPKGSTRRGTSLSGERWESQLPAAYGYIKRSKGADGDHLDVYVGDNPASKRVYVVDQKADGGRRFDEHKAVLGANSLAEARDLYASAFSDGRGRERIGAITPMSISQFRKWVAEGDTTQPLRYGKPDQRTTEDGYPANAKGAVKKPDSILEFIAKSGGIQEQTGELRAIGLRDRSAGFVVGAGPVVRRNGMTPDAAREAAEEAGYLPEGSSLSDLYDMLDRDARSNRTTFSQQDGDWAERWHSERNRKADGERFGEQELPALPPGFTLDEDAQTDDMAGIDPADREAVARDRVMYRLKDDGYPGEIGDEYSASVAERVASGATYEAAVESASAEFATRNAIQVYVEPNIPFFGDETNAAYPGTASESGSADQASGLRGEGPGTEGRAGEGGRTGAVRREGRKEGAEQAESEGQREGLTPYRVPAVPETVYHGTSSGGFDSFDTYGGRYGLFGSGGYFTESPDIALEYTRKGRGDKPTVYRASLTVSNPLDMDAPADVAAWEKAFPEYFDRASVLVYATNEAAYREVEENLGNELISDYEGAEIMQDGLRSMGHDGVTHIGGGRHKASKGVKHRVWIAFDPEQVGGLDPVTPQLEESGADGKSQLVIPGAERISAADAAQRKADAPMKAKAAQKEPDGLFSDDRDQTDLVDRARQPKDDRQYQTEEEPPIDEKPVATLTGTELMDFKGADDMPALRAAARRWYDENLRGETVTMQDGTVVSFNRRGRDKSTYGGKGDVLLRCIPCIPEIIKKGKVVLREPGSKPNVAERLVISAPVSLEGKKHVLAVSVHKTAEGEFQYDFTTDRDARSDDIEPRVEEGRTGAPRITRGEQDRSGSGSLDAGASPLNLMFWDAKGKSVDPGGWSEVGEMPAYRIPKSEQERLTGIVRDVSGLSEVQWADSIKLPDGAPGWGSNAPTTAAGFYDPTRDAITLALDTASDKAAYHEAFHRIQRVFMTDRERNVLSAETDRLRKIVASTEGRKDQAGKMSPKEIEAEAFAIWSERQDGKQADGPQPHIGIRRVWEKIRTALRRVGNFLTRNGYRTSEDVFAEAKTGKMQKRATEPLQGKDDRSYSLVERVPAVKRPQDAPKALLGERLKKTIGDAGKKLVKSVKTIDSKQRGHAEDGESLSDYAHRRLVDYLHPLRMMQESVGVPLNDLNDAYQTARLSEGTMRHQIQQIDAMYTQPMIEELVKGGATLEELHRYLYAMHVPERNRVVGMRNEEGSQLRKAVTDPSIVGASGWSTNKARETIKELAADRAKFHHIRRAGRLMRDMLDAGLQEQRKAGLISTETYDLLTKQWEHYVPLKGQDGMDEEGNFLPGAGRGFDVRGDESKTALGRFAEADNVIVNAIADAERSIIRQEKNKVATAVMRFINEFDPKGESIAEVYWSDDPAAKDTTIVPDIVRVPDVYKRVLGADGIVKSQKVGNPFRTRDDVMAAKIGGKTYYVRFKDPKVGLALRKMSVDEVTGFIMKAFRSVSNWQSIINTRANPAFVPINIIRDFQAGTVLALGKGFSAAQVARIAGGIPQAWAALWRHARGRPGTGEWDNLLKDYMSAGGKISFDQYKTIEETLAKVQKDLQRAGRGNAGAGARWRSFVKLVEDLNDTGENGLRLSVFAAARKYQQKTAKQAAFLARDLTVDFQKKGEFSPQANALYVFFNAAVQGNYNVAKALAKSPKVRGAAATFMLGGFMQHVWNATMAGDDDDGENAYLKMLRNEPWKLERQAVFFLPGTTDYLSMPLGFGFNAFWHLGTQGAAVSMGEKDALPAVIDSTRVAIDAFNPMGSGSIMSMVMPTMFDPAWDLGMNENFFGTPIYPEGNPFDQSPAPKSHTAFKSTHPAFKMTTEEMNELTGGDDIVPGMVDIYPDALEHLWGFFTGGIGRFVSQTAETAQRAASLDFEPKKTPWVRSFYGSVDEDGRRGEYYGQRERVQEIKGQLKSYEAEGRVPADFEKDHAHEIKAIPTFDWAEKQRRAINKDRRKVKGSKMDPAKMAKELEALDAEELKVMNEARKDFYEAGKKVKP
ncbi:MAG TPA: LPD38 domain-containing protein [Shinella sp.]|jgi:hypothetical protein|uniref:LPD38 domain-containing protein n=1 Tax=Shinella sp. TaxID=1870904 RepID=UPI002E0DBF51|nr:LPD38 domain-containing protein [Shinella sp.]